MKTPLTLSPLIECSMDELTDELLRRSATLAFGYITHEREGTGDMVYAFKGDVMTCIELQNEVTLRLALKVMKEIPNDKS